jgi:hypothetical protein
MEKLLGRIRGMRHRKGSRKRISVPAAEKKKSKGVHAGIASRRG